VQKLKTNRMFVTGYMLRTLYK